MCAPSLSDIHTSHKRAASALDYRFLLGKNRVISINDIEGDLQARGPYDKAWEKQLVLGIKSGTMQDIDLIIENMMKNLKALYLPIDRCYIHIQQIMISIMEVLYELDIREDAISG